VKDNKDPIAEKIAEMEAEYLAKREKTAFTRSWKIVSSFFWFQPRRLLAKMRLRSAPESVN